jgi:hypothetical protein
VVCVGPAQRLTLPACDPVRGAFAGAAGVTRADPGWATRALLAWACVCVWCAWPVGPAQRLTLPACDPVRGAFAGAAGVTSMRFTSFMTPCAMSACLLWVFRSGFGYIR